MTVILKVRLHIRNLTPSIEAYLYEEQSRKISSCNDGALGFYEEIIPTRKRTRTVAIWDQFLIQQSGS